MTRALLVLIALLAGCPPTPAPDPKPVPAPAPEPSCATACARAAELGCSFAKPTPKGASCEEVCANAIEWEPLDLGCRTRAASCTAWDECPP